MTTIQTTPFLWHAHVVLHQTVAAVQYFWQQGLLVPSVMLTVAVANESGSLITLLYADDDGIVAQQ